MSSSEYAVRPKVGRGLGIMATSALAIALAACGGGGGSDPAPADQPNGSPLPTPPTVPPLSSPAVKLDSNTVGTVSHWQSGDTTTGGQGAVVDGFTCADPIETFHIHAHLSVFLNGDQLIVPDHVGIPSPGGKECTYSIHTHDGSGEIHIEAAAPGTFTLGNFFHIWGQPLDRTNIAGIVGLPITVYILDEGNTAATEYTGDLTSIDLPAHRQITIQIGTAIKAIPTYDFNGA
jgi:hypothetical protein